MWARGVDTGSTTDDITSPSFSMTPKPISKVKIRGGGGRSFTAWKGDGKKVIVEHQKKKILGKGEEEWVCRIQ